MFEELIMNDNVSEMELFVLHKISSIANSHQRHLSIDWMYFHWFNSMRDDFAPHVRLMIKISFEILSHFERKKLDGEQ